MMTQRFVQSDAYFSGDVGRVGLCAALKIQCSSSVFYLLEEIGGYVLTSRGVLQVKVRPSANMTVSLCIRQGSKRNDDSVSVEELDWSAESS